MLKKPHITTKAASLNKKGQYSFIVDKKANKKEIKKNLEKIYTVTIESVNTMRYPGKATSRNTPTKIIKGKRAAYKKAIVTLASGDKIDVHADTI